MFPRLLSLAILKQAGLSPEAQAGRLSVASRASLAGAITAFPLPVTGTQGFKNAQVTRGGVALDEVDPDTMASRLVDGLYLAGEVLDVECSVVPGNGKLELTGNLGDVMKESCQAAVTYIRSRTSELGIDPDFHKNTDIHLHFPEGAVPKDGPSAGAAICLCVVSALTNRPVRADIAMTGEITLRGRVLPIGGIQEKTMAALRAGIHEVLLPEDNVSDLAEMDPNVRNAVNFTAVSHMDQVLKKALYPAGEEAE